MSSPFELTLPHLVYNIRNLMRDNRSDDIKMTDRQLEFIVNYYRARLIKNDVDKKRPISSNIIQDLGEVPLTRIDSTEDSVIKLGQLLLKTTDPVPKPLELNNKDAFVYVGGMDKMSNIDFVTKTQSRYNKFNKYGSKLPTSYYRNGHIYIENYPKNLKFINIEGIFADPREVSRYKNDGVNCYDILSDPYPMSEYMIGPMMEMIASKELTFFLQMIPDDVNDAADNDQVPSKLKQQQVER